MTMKACMLGCISKKVKRLSTLALRCKKVHSGLVVRQQRAGQPSPREGSRADTTIRRRGGGARRAEPGMLQKTVSFRLDVYLANKAGFERRRRKIRLDFDALYSLFASNLSFARIARRVGVSRPRIDKIFQDYFQELI